jgi:di/tricarboxylate transporter
VLPFSEYGVTTYGFSDIDAWVLWGSAIHLAQFLHCAAHGLNLSSTSQISLFVPIHLPIAALINVGLPMPTLSLVLSY